MTHEETRADLARAEEGIAQLQSTRDLLDQLLERMTEDARKYRRILDRVGRALEQ